MFNDKYVVAPTALTKTQILNQSGQGMRSKKTAAKGAGARGTWKWRVYLAGRVMSPVYYGAEVVNYPDSYFLSPLPHTSPPPLYCFPDEWLWSAKYSLLTLNCGNNAHVVVLTFPMLPHLNRPGYGFHSFQGKTRFQRKRSLCSLNSWWDCR